MQAGVDVGGDREAVEKHEAPMDDEPEALRVDDDIETVEKYEPEGEPEALDIGGDSEALKQASDAKGRRRRRRLVIYTTDALRAIAN